MYGSASILIIDDDAFLAQSLGGFLESRGARIRHASDGLEGLAVFEAERPDLVLLDLFMPGLDGFDTCERLRDLSAGKATPIIVMTAMEGWEPKIRAFQAGAVDYILKPFHFEEVEARVGTHLELRRRAAELKENQDRLALALASSGAVNRNLMELNEKLRRSEAIKSRFLALMRNEIVSPLTSIMGLAEEIEVGAFPLETARQVATVIKDEAFRLDCQIQNVFNAAELEAGEAFPVFTQVDLGSILRDLRGSFQAAAYAKGVDLAFGPGPEGHSVATDGPKVHRILANLVANAIEWGPSGSRVEVEARAEGEVLRLRVADAGPGLPEDVRRLLTGGKAPAPGTPEPAQGQRLGLLVVKALVDLLNGSIQAGPDGPGTSAVRVSLPLDPCAVPRDQTLDGNIVIFEDPQEF